MRTLVFLILLPVALFSGQPPAKVDTIGVINGKMKFIASFRFSASTTVDTLILPFLASKVEVVHRGASTGDTVEVSFAQSGSLGYSEMLVEKNEVVFRNFSTIVQNNDYGGLIRRVYVKSRQASVPVLVTVYN